MNCFGLKNKYAIVGVGYTVQGKIPDRTAIGFHLEACANALSDAGMGKNEIDALILYRHLEPGGSDEDSTAFTLAERLGIKPAVLSQEKYCTRNWLMYAMSIIESGFCNSALISYGDNGRSEKRPFVAELQNGKGTDELAAYGDLSTLSKYAMVARRAMHVYGTGPDVWKEIAIAQRMWANLNPNAAMFSKAMDDDMYYDSPYIVEPFRRLDASPSSDGGRALIITSAERAKDLKNKPVYISGIGCANDPESPYKLRLENESAAARAGKLAFQMAGMTPNDIDACQIYDCFTYTVEATLRDYGFFGTDEVKEYLTRKNIGPGGHMPVNTSGGMLSEGYFMGLTPFCEAVMQLMGRCGERQLGKLAGTKTPRTIMCSDNGGDLQANCAAILTSEV